MYFFSPLAGSLARLHVATAALALTLALTGCATVPPPNNTMNLAQNQLQAARDAGAADYAPVDLGFAQDKFQQAQTSMSERKFAEAANLAEESSADAELATSKAKLGAARTQMQAKLQQNTRLRQEGEQLAARQQNMEQAAPAPDSSTVAPVQDMPAPSASVLSAPVDGGFQSVPDDNQQPASSASTQGGQP